MTIGISQKIKEENRWICWKSRPKDNGKTDKIPTSPINGVTTIDVTDFSKATTYDQAKQTAVENDLGLGVLLGQGLSCIDLDDCVKEDGVSDRASEIVNTMDSYTEFSPSGLGLHIFYYGEKPGSRCRMKMEDFEIEIYEKERFITVTENMFYGDDVEERSSQIAEIYSDIFGEVTETVSREYGTCTEVDRKLRYALNHDTALYNMWHGKRSEGDDESRTDLALIGKLCYWLDRDPETVYDVFQKSPYFRSKSEKHKRKFLTRYDNYFLPSFDKVNNQLDASAWDWENMFDSSILRLTSSPVEDEPDEESPKAEVEPVEKSKTKQETKKKKKKPVDTSELDEHNKDLLGDDGEGGEGDTFEDYPWLYQTDNGKTVILENIFARWFTKKFNIMTINGIVYNSDGELPDNYLVHRIQGYISSYINSNLARTASKLLEATKNESYKRLPRPKVNLIHVKDHTLNVSGEGVKVQDPAFTINRLNAKYDKECECPQWLAFLSELLEDEYIPILQEYMGYCLSPTNVAQMACFIIGNGGEGKSIIIQVLQRILGRNQLTGQIHKLSANNFMLSNLENRLAFLDDDINLAGLEDTSVFKQLVTNNGEMTVERKGVQAYSAQIYAKVLACGNGTLRSRYDKSDGFYRRLMILKCKPKPENRVDDKLLHMKILKESDAIFMWMLEGLQRLMANGWSFSQSQRIERNVDEMKDDIENVRLFLKDVDYVTLAEIEDITATTPEIYDCYQIWCDDNSYEPMGKRMVANFLKKHASVYGIEYTNKLKRGEVHKRGYRHIQMKKETAAKSGNLNLVRNKKKA